MRDALPPLQRISSTQQQQQQQQPVGQSPQLAKRVSPPQPLVPEDLVRTWSRRAEAALRRRASALLTESLPPSGSGPDEVQFAIDFHLPEVPSGATVSALTAGVNTRIALQTACQSSGGPLTPALLPQLSHETPAARQGMLPSRTGRPPARAASPTTATPLELSGTAHAAADISPFSQPCDTSSPQHTASGAPGVLPYAEAQRRFEDALEDIVKVQRRVRQAADELRTDTGCPPPSSPQFAGADSPERSAGRKRASKVRSLSSAGVRTRKVQTGALAKNAAAAQAANEQVRRRREARDVAKAVTNRICQLRGDAEAWQRFDRDVRELVRRRAKLRLTKMAVVAERRQVPSSPVEKTERLRERRNGWEARRERVLRLHEAMRREIEELQDQDPRSPRSPHSPGAPSLAEIQQAWGAACALLSRHAVFIAHWGEVCDCRESRALKEAAMARRRAACCIQRWWRRRQGHIDWVTQEVARVVIARFVRKWQHRRRERLRHEYAPRVVHFLGLYTRAMRMPHHLHIFLKRVKCTQRMFRRGKAITAARMTILMLQFERELGIVLSRAEKESERLRATVATMQPHGAELLAGAGAGRRPSRTVPGDRRASRTVMLGHVLHHRDSVHGRSVQFAGNGPPTGTGGPGGAYEVAKQQAAEADLVRSSLNRIDRELVAAELRSELRQVQAAHRARLRHWHDEFRKWNTLRKMCDQHFTAETLLKTKVNDTVAARTGRHSPQPGQTVSSSRSPSPRPVSPTQPPSRGGAASPAAAAPSQQPSRSRPANAGSPPSVAKSAESAPAPLDAMPEVPAPSLGLAGQQPPAPAPAAGGAAPSAHKQQQQPLKITTSPKDSPPLGQRSPRSAKSGLGALLSPKGGRGGGGVDPWLVALSGMRPASTVAAAPVPPVFPLLLPPAKIQRIIEQCAAEARSRPQQSPRVLPADGLPYSAKSLKSFRTKVR